MPQRLRKVVFSEDLLPLVTHFDCGHESWETEVSEWIKSPDGALKDLGRKRCDVWLHIDDGDAVVGFSSLGQSNWQARQQLTGLRGQFGERVVGEILANMGDPPISIDEDVRGQREA